MEIGIPRDDPTDGVLAHEDRGVSVDEARKKSWIVISMKNDWKRVFGFE